MFVIGKDPTQRSPSGVCDSIGYHPYNSFYSPLVLRGPQSRVLPLAGPVNLYSNMICNLSPATKEAITRFRSISYSKSAPRVVAQVLVGGEIVRVADHEEKVRRHGASRVGGA